MKNIMISKEKKYKNYKQVFKNNNRSKNSAGLCLVNWIVFFDIRNVIMFIR